MSDKQGQGSLRGIVRAMRLTSIGSVLSIVFGVGTSKIIAVVAGPAGVALLGAYRTLGTIVTSVVSLGLNERATQKLSLARTDEEARELIGAALALLMAQAAVVLLIAATLAGPIAGWLLGADAGPAHVGDVRWVLALTVGVLGMQTVLALLNGQVRVADATRVSVLTSAATFLTVYPFLRLGTVGLAFVIGGTCFVGLAVGLFYLARANRLGASDLVYAGRWGRALTVLPLSVSLTLEPLVVTGSALWIQALLARHYGIEALGLYNAATMLETTAVMVLTASMRSYFLPTLGRLDRDADKEPFLNRVLMLLMLAVVAGVTLMVLLAPLGMRILFSGRFVAGARLVGILGVSLIGQMFGWCYTMYLVHRGAFTTRLLLEAVWAAAGVGATWYCTAHALPIDAVAWVHVATYALLGALTAAAAAARYGRGLVSLPNVLLGALSTAALSLLAARY